MIRHEYIAGGFILALSFALAAQARTPRSTPVPIATPDERGSVAPVMAKAAATPKPRYLRLQEFQQDIVSTTAVALMVRNAAYNPDGPGTTWATIQAASTNLDNAQQELVAGTQEAVAASNRVKRDLENLLSERDTLTTGLNIH
jgi:hypothetical protein